MTPYSLARTIAAAVAQDAALQAWATDEFDKALTVYLGVPSADFPNLETDAPFVAFGDPERRVEPTGLEAIGDGLALLLAAVSGALPDRMTIIAADQATDTLGAHDYVDGFLALEIEELLVMGQAPLD